MTSDEIRERVRGIVALANEDDGLEWDILKLAEEILGKPLEPEFDESKVTHGSVWGYGSSKVILIQHRRTAGYVKVLYLDDFAISELVSLPEMKRNIINAKAPYLGQFDFSWPQKGQLLDEAVELLRHWLNAPYRSLSDNTSEFLAKLEASK